MNLLRTVPSLLAIAGAVCAQDYRVNVVLNNAAPTSATSLTPVWVGFHDGSFDTYNGGTLASTLPIPGSNALERIAEDGNTGPLMADFATLAVGRFDATVPGPAGPLAPGDSAQRAFLLNPNDMRDRYFSYAAMVLPSNDAFIANGNPMAHRVFDSAGSFVGTDFFVAGPGAVNDAGTEANDEIPMNTAFFGQSAPDTGVTEANVIVQHPGFNPRGSGGILDATRFRRGDFTLDGYPFMHVTMRAAPAVTEQRVYGGVSLGAFQVPPVASSAVGISGYALIDGGTRMLLVVQAFGLADLTMAHLHFGAPGQNGPVVADLIANAATAVTPEFFIAEIQTGDLVGQLADYPLDALVNRIEAGEIYVNLHTTAFPAGEIRGQLSRLQ